LDRAVGKLYPASSVTGPIVRIRDIGTISKRDVAAGLQNQQSAASAQIPGRVWRERDAATGLKKDM